MNFGALLFVLITSATSTVEPVSALVSDDHQHDWSEIFVETESTALLDVSYLETTGIEGTEYPTILLRHLKHSPSSGTRTSDFIMAIDCEGAAMAGIKVYDLLPPHEATGVAIGVPYEPQPRFTTIYPQNKERVAPIFKHACGADWSMSPNK